MKKLSVVLNVVLLVAVAGLYYMQFSCPSSCGTSTKASTGVATAKSGVIAYVNMDSLERNYKFFTDLAEKFGKKAQESEKEFATRKKVFQEEVIDFQRKVKKEMLTPNQAKALQQQLAEKEQNYIYTGHDQPQCGPVVGGMGKSMIISTEVVLTPHLFLISINSPVDSQACTRL